MKKEVRLGIIVRAFGIKGEVKVALDTDLPEKRFAVGNVIHATLNQTKIDLVVKSFRMHQNHALVTFEGYNSIDDVSELVMTTLSTVIETDHEDRVAFFDLVGCSVIEKDSVIGTIIEVLDYPAHAVLKVKTDTKTVLIPYVDAFILDVEPDKKLVTIQSIEGLL